MALIRTVHRPRRRLRRSRRVVRSRYSRKRVSQRRAYPHIAPSTKLRAVGLPPKMFAKLEYTDLYSLTIDTHAFGPWGAAAVQSFQSSLYDPDYTGFGHQPMYFDQLCSNVGPYQWYRVYGIGFRFEFVNTNTSQNMPCCIHFTDIASPISVTSKSDWLKVEEQSTVKPVWIGPASSKPTIVKGYMSVAKTLGTSYKSIRDDDRFRAIYSATPADTANINIYITSGNVSEGNVVQIRAKLVYYCEFSGLMNQSQS